MTWPINVSYQLLPIFAQYFCVPFIFVIVSMKSSFRDKFILVCVKITLIKTQREKHALKITQS